MSAFLAISSLFFAIIGIALGSVNCWNNATSINGGTFVWNDLTALVVGLAVVSALLSLALGSLSKRSPILALLSAATIAGCVFTSVGYTLSRVGQMADTHALEGRAHNQRVDDYRQAIVKLEALRDKEASNKFCGKRCLALQNKLDRYRVSLAALGPKKTVDPAGDRLEAVFGTFGLTADGYRTTHPVVTAVTLELGTSLLLAISGMFASACAACAPRHSLIDITPIPLEDPLTQSLQIAGAASNRELAKRLDWSEAKTSRRVKLLTHQGLVKSEQRGRAKVISLS